MTWFVPDPLCFNTLSTLKLICSLFSIPPKSMIQNIIDRSERCVRGRIISIQRVRNELSHPVTPVADEYCITSFEAKSSKKSTQMLNGFKRFPKDCNLSRILHFQNLMYLHDTKPAMGIVPDTMSKYFRIDWFFTHSRIILLISDRAKINSLVICKTLNVGKLVVHK